MLCINIIMRCILRSLAQCQNYLFSFFKKIVVLGRDTLWHLQKFLLYIKYTWIHPFHCSPLPPSPIPGIVSTDIIFSFTYIYTQYLYCIHPPPFLHFHPLPLVPSSTGRTCSASCSLILYKKRRRKNDIFGGLTQLHREFPCVTSVFICILVQFGSSPLFFFSLH
jgi:hypothetical protein